VFVFYRVPPPPIKIPRLATVSVKIEFINVCVQTVLLVYSSDAVLSNLRNKPTNVHVQYTLYHILLITNIFQSLLRSSTEQLHNSTNYTTNCQTVSVEPLNITIDASNSTHGHKMSAYMLLQTKYLCNN
jgi:hypothetical protein